MAGVGTRFWVPLMERTRLYVADSASEGSYHNLMDSNPDTRAIGAAAWDLATQIYVDSLNNNNRAYNWIGFFIRNYDTYGGGLSLTVYGTNSPPNWGGSIIYETATISSDKHFPLIIRALSQSYEYRYWKFDLFRSGEIIEGGLFFIGRYYDLTPRWNWDSADTPGFFLDVARSFGGRVHTNLAGNYSHRQIVRTYENISTADVTILRNIWEDTKGGTYPMLITDDIPSTGWSHASSVANSKTSKLVRFNHQPDGDGRVTLGETETQSGLWNVTLYMEELPWTGTGVLE